MSIFTRASSSRLTLALVEVILYRPALAQIGTPTRAAVLLHNLSRYHGGITLFDDPGEGVHSVLGGNTIRPRYLANIDGRWRVPIPIHGHVSFEDVHAILASLPKIDERINPGGMFPWTFGNYVRRFLRELDSCGLLATPDLLRPDEFYDQYLVDELGDGHM